jgi:hypothetical protein
MPPATLAQRAQMDRDVSEVEAQFRRGAAKQLGASLLNADTLLLMTSPLTAFIGVTTDSTRRVVEGMEAERQTLVTWRTRWRKWADAGQRDDGSTYTVAQWQAVGKSVASGVQFWTGEAVGRTAFAAVEQAAADTKKMVEAAAEAVQEYLPTPADWKGLGRGALYVGAGLLVIGGLAAFGYAVRSVR